jgi:hypothetical protein
LPGCAHADCNQRGLDASAPKTALRVITDIHILQDVFNGLPQIVAPRRAGTHRLHGGYKNIPAVFIVKQNLVDFAKAWA